MTSVLSDQTHIKAGILSSEYAAEEIRCVFDDNSKIIFCQIFIKTYVVGAH